MAAHTPCESYAFVFKNTMLINTVNSYVFSMIVIVASINASGYSATALSFSSRITDLTMYR